MYIMLEIRDGKTEHIQEITPECIDELEASIHNSWEVLDVMNGFSFVKDALMELENWCQKADRGSENLFRNIHTAEGYTRDFLFEMRTYLDHLEKNLVRMHGKKSEIYHIFKEAAGKTYDTCPEYAFTYHLRNYGQHCAHVVHNLGNSKKSYICPSAFPETLLKEYKEWKEIDKKFINSFEGTINLLEVFEKTFNAFGIIQTAVIQYLLDHNGVCESVHFLRRFADQNFSRKDIQYWHFADMRHEDGSDAQIEEYRVGVSGLDFKVMAVDWSMMYELTDAMKVRESIH